MPDVFPDRPTCQTLDACRHTAGPSRGMAGQHRRTSWGEVAVVALTHVADQRPADTHLGTDAVVRHVRVEVAPVVTVKALGQLLTDRPLLRVAELAVTHLVRVRHRHHRHSGWLPLWVTCHDRRNPANWNANAKANGRSA